MHEALLSEIQRRLELLAASLSRVEARMAATEQSQQKQWGLMPPQSSGGGGTGVMFCVTPSTGSWAASGPPPGSTPGGPFTADVYKISGGSYVSVAGSASVYNGFPSSPGNSKVVAVCPNGDGTFSVVGESCA